MDDGRVTPAPLASSEPVSSVAAQYRRLVARGRIEADPAQAELVENLRKSAKVERLDKPAAPDPALNPAAPAKK